MMLKEFYEVAQKAIKKYQPGVIQRTESDTMLYLYTKSMSFELSKQLSRLGFMFAVELEEDEFIQVLQPTIPHINGEQYGYIPEQMIELMNNNL